MNRPAFRGRLGSVLLLLLSLGCGLPISSGSFGPERRILESGGARLDREFSLGIGPWLMGLALHCAEDVELEQIAGQVEKVEVAVFKITGPKRPGQQEFLALAGRDDWYPVVRVRHGADMFLILARCREEKVTELFVAALDDEELVLTRLTGHLDQALPSMVALGQ